MPLFIDANIAGERKNIINITADNSAIAEY